MTYEVKVKNLAPLLSPKSQLIGNCFFVGFTVCFGVLLFLKLSKPTGQPAPISDADKATGSNALLCQQRVIERYEIEARTNVPSDNASALKKIIKQECGV
jgi:hypothetical protein